MITGDANIIHMIVKAGRAFRAVEDLDPEEEGAPLADWLRSGAEIGPAERELLADLVTGEWRRSRGAPNRKGPGHAESIEIVQYYSEVLKAKSVRKIAKYETSEKFGISERTVERYLEESEARDKAVRDALAALDKK